ncbi:uncharacterized protein BT62DRAFT_1006241 [Guyanagaster necrorhizus]|uniref:Xylanolytic transcriptional activator regulatory domain-containing protein n=1 Tax=Guyanagaster necrorhizus TaxID=856835 RepID=A0A9P8AS92_9AGAR|nr:uncharacterized protein BT62DRAFT_1006241 [Guyanagaster necrorhizus MCA 3950]KAG7446059.1 hypothetical protein BT62DRAFT_1006241 [Guyanagaster necrorhizus MCA 3950]
MVNIFSTGEGDRNSNRKCQNCFSNDVDCTYIAAAKMIPYTYSSKEYIEDLERRLEKTRRHLRKFVPDTVIEEELIGKSQNQKRQKHKPTMTEHVSNVGNVDILANEETAFEDDSELDRLKQVAIDDPDLRNFGKSSVMSFTSTALKIRQEMGIPSARTSQVPLARLWVNRWDMKYKDIHLHDYTFPEPDLLDNLVELYFIHLNRFWPLLHQPTFERSLAAALHRTDSAFAGIVLVVCAIGSRFSNDPRVRVDHYESPYRHGWKWFVQVHRVSVLQPPSLFDLQKCVLSVFYVEGFSAHRTWTMLGTAVRMAQDLGAHRKRKAGWLSVPEEELLKRAFWVLACMDRILGMALGRPYAIQEEDIDADLPVECDDEYWDGDEAFIQPSNVPSTMSFFISYLKLNRIFGRCLRTIYSLGRPTALRPSVGKRSMEDIVAELDSSLNEWVDSVPQHIRWEPQREKEIFYSQSVFLYCSYYHLRILIHRPFIPPPGKSSSLSFPSLVISTNAARSIGYILDCQSRQQPDSPKRYCPMSIFSAAIILLFNCWSNPAARSESEDVKHIVQCVNTLQTFERQWLCASQFCDFISHLVSGVYPNQQRPVPVHETIGVSPRPLFHVSQWAELMGMPFPSSSWASSSDDAYTQNFWTVAEDAFYQAHDEGSISLVAGTVDTWQA